MNNRTTLPIMLGMLILIVLLAGFMLKPGISSSATKANGEEETTAALIRNLSDRVDALEHEIAAMRESSEGRSESSVLQADVAKVLEEMSDRWMRSMSDSLEDIKGELYAIRKILEQ